MNQWMGVFEFGGQQDDVIGKGIQPNRRELKRYYRFVKWDTTEMSESLKG